MAGCTHVLCESWQYHMQVLWKAAPSLWQSVELAASLFLHIQVCVSLADMH